MSAFEDVANEARLLVATCFVPGPTSRVTTGARIHEQLHSWGQTWRSASSMPVYWMQPDLVSTPLRARKPNHIGRSAPPLSIDLQLYTVQGVGSTGL